MTRDLPESLDLPLRTGEPWWYFLGGRPSVDLVNTLRERWRRRVETITGPEDLGRWLVAAGCCAQAPPIDADGVARARRLREAIDALVVAQVEGAPAPEAAAAEIARWLEATSPRPELGVEDGHAVLRESRAASGLDAVLGDIALDAARMLGTEERGRVRVCASPTCSARFYDASRPSTRRWCSMGECGNRAKARRHRARTTREETT